MGDASLFWQADYEAVAEPQGCVIPDRRYLTLDISGTADVRADVAELLAVAREIRTVSGGSAPAYHETPLEGFWYAEGRAAFDPRIPGVWSWTAAVCLPGFLGEELTQLVIDYAAGRSADRIAVHNLHEGYAIQALHQGGFETVAETLGRITAHLEANHLEAAGTYHEIYLTDPLTTAAGDARTIVRQPCRVHDVTRRRPPSLIGAGHSAEVAAPRPEIRLVPAVPASLPMPTSGAARWALTSELSGGWGQSALSGRRRWRRPRS